MDLKRVIGLQVKAARRGKGLTQEQLADMIGRTVETVSNIERAQTLPTLDTLARLSRSLDVPLRDFFGDEGGFERTSRRRLELELHIRELVRSLSDDDLELAIGQVGLLAKRMKRS